VTGASALLIAGLGVLLVAVSAAPASAVEGIVIDEHGAPVAGAVVRQRTTLNSTRTDAAGAFTLGGLPEGITVTVTAWDEGFYPAGVEIAAPASGVTITVRPHPVGDNPDHQWYTSMPDPEHAIGCGHCMVAFPEWVTNAHGTSGTNPRFFSLYNGTDLSGTSQLGGGYRDDFPLTAGNCATCHAPGAATDDKFLTTDMNELVGVEKEGVFCDFCHKVSDVYLNPATGLPYPNSPGVVSMELNRPPSDTHMFYGPFDDVTRRVSYLELETKSQFCAPCHQFSFWGTPIYESFREWLESPYPAAGIECQTCHMAPTGVEYFVFPEKGGLIRDQQRIPSHLQPGAADEAFLQNTVSMTVDAQRVGPALAVTVRITNTEAGHHVPTDFPGRHMILTVAAEDGAGLALPQASGSVVPDWGGAQAGLPGKAFAKVLRDVETGQAPVVTYWKQALIQSDNRIPAKACDVSRYAFAAPSSGDTITVTVELLFRRAFQDVLDARGWDSPDITMETETLSVSLGSWWGVYLPAVLR
jgi:hypothetical protein